jgi:hypothetical protein
MELLQVRNDIVAFHGDESIKLKYLVRVRAHRLADQIVKGQYWENGKGCAVGCTLHSGNHADFETELGIPGQLAYLQDVLFENLPIDEARMFPEHFLESIPVGADLYPAFWKFMLYLLLDDVYGLNRVEENKEILRQAAVLYERAIDGEEILLDDYRAERDEIPLYLTARGLLDALDPVDSLGVMDARSALIALGALEHNAAIGAANDWDEINQWAVLEEWDEEHFRDAVAVAWRDKLLECLSQARVTRAISAEVRVSTGPVSIAG